MDAVGLTPFPAVPGAVVVAIPVKDEADSIGACLLALANQEGAAADRIVLLVNDTTDGTVAVVRGLAPSLPVRVEVVEHQFAPGRAGAGQARRLAMQHAAVRAGSGGVLLTTDADGRVAPDWLANNLRHLWNGADAVAGCAVIDPVDALLIPAALHEADALECAYGDLLDEIASLLNPDPCDPWPRHTEHSGASICVTLDAYRRAGGIPAVALGEDRLFFEALRRIDAHIRHARDVRVTVSGRITGRARGGMADTIRRRLVAPDLTLDDRLETTAMCARRARLRARLRAAYAARRPDSALTRLLCRDLGFSPDELGRLWKLPTFGEAWAEAEARSPALVRAVVAVAQLDEETEAARALRDALTRHEPAAADQADGLAVVSA